MSRIRTVKPQLFRHETLFNLEKETGLPIRVAWMGLFTVADREGRFKWRPREMKLDVLPWDDVDFETILLALESVQLIQRYQVNGVFYGVIPTWHRHQTINVREAQSVLPAPEAASPPEPISSELTETHVSAHETHVSAHGEGKGREKEKEGKRKGKDLTAAHASARTGEVWLSYSDAYLSRYGEEPVRNARVNSMVKQLVERLGDEAIPVVAFYVHHNDPFYCKSAHAISLCLRDAEGLRTQWKTGRKITTGEVRSLERTDNLKAQMERMKASI